MERQVRAGLPAITPSEQELKESGMFQEAQIDLMRVDQEALSEQRRYLEEMASELRLKIISQKGLATLKKETGFEWTNGWTKHKRKPKKPRLSTVQKWFIKEHQIPMLQKRVKRASPKTAEFVAVLSQIEKLRVGGWDEVTEGAFQSWKKQREVKLKPKPKKKKEAIDEKVVSRYKGDPFPITRAELNQMKGSRALSREWAKFHRGIRLDAGRAIERRKAKPKPKKRKKSHVERTGKTMRALRKVNGVKVFAFPDDVWKVRKPRRRKRK